MNAASKSPIQSDPQTAPGAMLLGHLREYQRDPLELFLRLQRQYGDVVRLRLGPNRTYLISHPDDLRHVFATNASNYERPGIYDRGRIVFGGASFTSRGDTWVAKRRTVSSLFHPKILTELSEGIENEISRSLSRWAAFCEAGQSFDAVYENLLLTLGISSKSLLGFDPGDSRDELCRAVEEVLVFLKNRMGALVLVPESLPTRGNRRFRRAMKVLDDVVYRIIDRCREEGGRNNDVISALVREKESGNPALATDRDLRDEIMTFFLAGFHTTADSLSWSLFQISGRPDVQDRLHQEVIALNREGPPRATDLPSLPYAKMVIEESMRLYSPAHFIPRRPIQDDVIRGMRIPKGSLVVACQWVTHRHPEIWEDPERFDPERFAAERAKSIPRYAYFPFGLGPQTCVGKNLAMMELPMMLAGMMQRFSVELVPGQVIEPCTGMTMRPSGEIRVKLTARESRPLSDASKPSSWASAQPLGA